MKERVTAIFDIGKTNKKFLLFNEHYEVVLEEVTELPEAEDEDGFPCEDITRLTSWIQQMLQRALHDTRFQMQHLNFTTYGASFVGVGAQGQPVSCLYNYLKPFPEDLAATFFNQYGPEKQWSLQTASPSLGMLNSGLQLYWMKYQRPELYQQMRWALHLPQYVSYLVQKQAVAERTSIGCHTGLWDYQRSDYHAWVKKEEITSRFPEIVPSHQTYSTRLEGQTIRVGVGLHDSSASLLPYLKIMREPFLLLSTGTWSITLNPYNQEPLNEQLLEKDCLNFLSPEGEMVRASRLFLGHEHSQQVKQMETFFHRQPGAYKAIVLHREVVERLVGKPVGFYHKNMPLPEGQLLPDYEWEKFQNFEEAYQQLMLDLVRLQIASLRLAMGSTPVRKLIVTGGFCDNTIFLQLLANQLPQMTVMTSRLQRASAIGAGWMIEENVGEEVQKSMADFKTCAPESDWSFLKEA